MLIYQCQDKILLPVDRRDLANTSELRVSDKQIQ